MAWAALGIHLRRSLRTRRCWSPGWVEQSSPIRSAALDSRGIGIGIDLVALI
jgi:hypothetical protein